MAAVTSIECGRPLPLAVRPIGERGDAARNRALLLAAARRLIAERGAEAVTMDDVAAAAGVGKGTLFRRFGSRAGLMLTLLDDAEKALQHDMLFGPAPLGPGATPLQRLLAYGHRRMRFNLEHEALLADAARQPPPRSNPPYLLQRTHLRMLLGAAGTTGDLDFQAEALLALLDAAYLRHRTVDGGASIDDLLAGWDAVVGKLCGS